MKSSVNRIALAALGLASVACAQAATDLSRAARSAAPDAVVRDDTLILSEPLKSMPASPVVKQLKAAARERRAVAGVSEAAAEAAAAVQPLKIWQYTYTSPRDGNAYSGSIVGSDPRLNGARTTSIPVLIVPLRIAFTGTVRTFDPTKPDVGCMGSPSTALAQTTASPMFNLVPNYTFNGVNMGNVTFIDGFQRAQFWQDAAGGPMVNAKPAFHTALPYTVAAVQTLTMANSRTGTGAAYAFTGTECGANSTAVENPAKNYAFIDINYLDVQLNNIIAALNVPPSTFVFFLTYRTYMTDGAPGSLSGNCCILGYHSSDFINPANPGHTYGIAGLDTGFLFSGVKNTSTMAHEILEWMNDPSGNNLVPEWGNIGQVGGCTTAGTGQNNLETGDPMSGLNHPGVVMPNGITYFAQENAFFSWFLATGFTGAGGKYSSNGTFTGFAKNCPPGGTN